MTENQTPVFGCCACREERSVEAEDLRVAPDGHCWCSDCFEEEHSWAEWLQLRPFVPKYRREIEKLWRMIRRCGGKDLVAEIEAEMEEE